MLSVLYLVLSEQEGQQHQQAAVVYDPPHVDGALLKPFLIGREVVDVLGHQQGLVGGRGFPHRLCERREQRSG